MAKQVVTTARFEKDISRIYYYLLSEFSAKTAYEFLERLSQKIDLIRKQPDMGAISQKRKDVRGVILVSHNKIFYRQTNKKIILLSIGDMRRDNSRNRY